MSINIKEYKDNITFNEMDLPIINIAKCYIKYDDKEQALQQAHKLQLGFINDYGEKQLIGLKDFDIAITEILNTDFVEKYAQRRIKDAEQTLKYIDALDHLDEEIEKIYKERSQLLELKEVLKAIYK